MQEALIDAEFAQAQEEYMDKVAEVASMTPEQRQFMGDVYWRTHRAS